MKEKGRNTEASSCLHESDQFNKPFTSGFNDALLFYFICYRAGYRCHFFHQFLFCFFTTWFPERLTFALLLPFCVFTSHYTSLLDDNDCSQEKTDVTRKKREDENRDHWSHGRNFLLRHSRMSISALSCDTLDKFSS